ncbi:hypothetical protein OEZ85_000647 [Tetradesmus obliquus]|uniref:Leucine-rich repeat-containing N-terminal plant-type domain-containing protein n=1 Tax=Tetradesmus obliquus TaxID=3088 RepID=A0ABY8UJF5_TETOB|nr:hypothetical protein OEZ85_000647 [Tetradesmus obliquus]
MPCERLIAPKAAAPAYCSWFGITCCKAADVAAGECSVVHSVLVIEMPLNNLNVSVSDPKWLRTVQALHDCGMTKLSLEANQLSGEMDDAWGDMVHLKVLNLANAWIGGPIPEVLRRLSGLTDINLSNNFLTGTLPDWLGSLENLEVLNLGSQAGTTEETGLHGTIPPDIGKLSKLRELNLEANWLTGEIPEEICSEGSSLIQLNLRANSLEGRATPVQQCAKLVQLDLSNNDLTGPLPVADHWRDLTTYQLSDNSFTGRLPLQLCLAAHILETLDLSRNQLTGALPNQVGVLGGLKTFLIASNRFTGTITEDLLYLPAIRHIDMSDNNFFGILPAVALGFPYGLLDIDVSNNSGITGIVPAQMGYLFALQKARFTNTSMACSGIIRPYNLLDGLW